MSSQCPHRSDGPPTVRDVKRTESAEPVGLRKRPEHGSRPYSRLYRIRPRHGTLRRPTLTDTAPVLPSEGHRRSSCGTRSPFALRDTTMTVPAPPCPPVGAEPLAEAQPRHSHTFGSDVTPGAPLQAPRGAPLGSPVDILGRQFWDAFYIRARDLIRRSGRRGAYPSRGPTRPIWPRHTAIDGSALPSGRSAPVRRLPGGTGCAICNSIETAQDPETVTSPRLLGRVIVANPGLARPQAWNEEPGSIPGSCIQEGVLSHRRAVVGTLSHTEAVGQISLDSRTVRLPQWRCTCAWEE